MSDYTVGEDHIRGGWGVYRRIAVGSKSSSRWHVATYASKELANDVADFLTRNLENEK
jgi:hypothetical protein